MITPTQWAGAIQFFRTVLPVDLDTVHCPSGGYQGSIFFYLDGHGEFFTEQVGESLRFRVGISRGRMDIQVIARNGGVLRKRLYNHHNPEKLMRNFNFAFQYPALWIKHKAKPKWMEHATVAGEIRHGHNT